jgi:hypothetical protein
MLRALQILLVASLITVRGDAALELRTIDGRMVRPFEPAGAATVLFFVATDCPISNSYAPEIQKVCKDYAGRNVDCLLIYEDVDVETAAHPATLDDAVRKHLADFGYGGVGAVVDRTRVVARQARAVVTPQAVVVDSARAIRYRGRIDNFYAALGKPRQQVTEHDLRDALDAILAGRPVVKAETKALGCYIAHPALLRR